MKIERGIKLSIILFFIILLVIIGVKKVNSAGCPQDSIAIGSSCCILGATSCDVTNPGSGWLSYNCDASSIACGKCCSSSGTSSLICKIPNNFYRSFLWFSSRCCGDDPGNAIDTFNGDSAIGCCCASDGRIGWTNDQVCGSNRQWCIDGAYCTNSVVYSSTAFSGIQLSGDNIVCGPCGYSGTICDTNADTLTNGICASGSCLPSGTVSKSGSSHYTGCAIGRECDTAISPQYVRDGFCTSIRLNGCCSLSISSGESSGVPTWNSGNEGCDCDSSGSYCDITPATGPGNDGICAGDVCVASGLVSKVGSTYYNVCATNRECTSDVGLGPYVRNGYCAIGTCATSVIVEDNGVDECGILTPGCITGSFIDGDEQASCNSADEGSICDATPINGPTAEGVCVDSGCRTSGGARVNCGIDGCTSIDLTDVNMYLACDSSSGDSCDNIIDGNGYGQTGTCTSSGCTTSGFIGKDTGGTHYAGCAVGRECDSNPLSGDYLRNGYCASTSCCTSLINSGETIAPGNFAGGTAESCICVGGQICSNTPNSGNPPSPTGVCAPTTCASGLVAWSTASGYVTSCAAGRECDTNVNLPSVEYRRDGWCISATCDTDTIVASLDKSECGTGLSGCVADNWLDGDEASACSFSNAGAICDNTPSNGPSGEGICADNSCEVGLVSLNCANFGSGCDVNDLSDGNLANFCTGTTGYACDFDLGATGWTQDGTCTNSGCTTSGAISYASGIYYQGCSNGRGCDSNPLGGNYLRNGYCVGTTCATSEVVASTDNSECGILTGCGNGCLQANFNDNDEDFQCDSSNEGAICDASPSTGPSAEGVCVDSGCRTSGGARVNCGIDGCQKIDFTSANMYLACDSSSGDSCDNNVDSNGYGQTGTCAANTCDTSGETCFDGANYQLSCSSCGNDKLCDSDATYGGDFNANGLCCSSSCIANSSRIQGQACCNNANCASGLTCSSGVCVPLDGELYRTQIPDGTYGWKCEAEDTSENIGSSETRIFTLDTKPPIISNVKNTCGLTSITITWETNENANGTVKYGTTLDLTSGISYDVNYNLIRSIIVSGLSSGVVYYYNLTSCDRFNHCITSGYYNFTAPG